MNSSARTRVWPSWGLAKRRLRYSLMHLFAWTLAVAMVLFFFSLPLNWTGFFRFWGQLWNGEVWQWLVGVSR